MDKKQDRSGGLLQKKFRQYLLPMLLASLASSLSEFLDGIVVSNLLGSDALALINLGMPVILIYAVVYSLIGIGGSSQYAVLLGEGNREEARNVFSVSMYAMVGISLALLGAGVLSAGPLARLLTDDASLLGPLEHFLRAQFLSAPVMIGTVGLSYFVTNEGHPHVSTLVFAVANLLNIAMDYVYICLFHMGVEATAYATATGYAVGFLIELFVILRSCPGLRLSKVGAEELRQLPGFCMRGSGSAFNQFGFAFRYVVINALAQALAGSLGLVVFSLCMQTFSFISIFVAGVVQTMIPIVAVLIGERDREGIRTVVRQTNRYQLFFTAAVLVLFEGFPQWILAVYGITDAAEAAEGLWAIRVFSLGYILRNLAVSVMMYLQTIGEKKETLLISFMDAIVLGGVCLVFGGLFGIRGIWAAFPANSVLVMAVILLCAKKRAEKNGKTSLELFPLPPADAVPLLDITIEGSRKEAADASQRIIEFAVSQGIPQKKAYMLGLAVEEMAVYTIEKQEEFKEQGGIDILAFVREDSVLIHFRSGGRPFSPASLKEGRNGPADSIRVLEAAADSVEYDCVLGMNSTWIRVSV